MHLPVVCKAERKVAPGAKPENEGGSKMSGLDGESIPPFAPSFAPAGALANVLSYRGLAALHPRLSIYCPLRGHIRILCLHVVSCGAIGKIHYLLNGK
jgi:hypothetical protein